MGKKMQFHPIIASSKSEIPSTAVTSAYHCADCEHDFAVSFVPKNSETASVEAAKKAVPFCVHCSSANVSVIEGATFLPCVESELSAIKCPECAKHNILNTEEAVAYKGAITCVACGTDLSYPTPEESAKDEDEDDEDTDLGGDSIDDEDMEDEDEGGEDVKASTESEPTDNGEKVSLKEKASEEYPDDKSDNPTVEASEGQGNDENPSADNHTNGHNPQTDNEGDEGLVNEEKKEVMLSTVALRTLINVTDPKFVRANEQTIACLEGDVVIATLKRSADNERAFDSKGYMNGLRLSLAKEGLDETLAEFNFKEVSVQLDSSFIENKRIEAAVKTVTAKTERELATSMETVKQCLEIAAAGLNKGWFKKYDSPLKTALASELAAYGFRNPQNLIDKVFKEQSDAHNAVLIEVALDLHKKPVDVRNELADAIGESNYTDMNAPVTSKVTEEASKIEAKLETPVVAEADDEDSANVRKVVASLGGKKLFS